MHWQSFTVTNNKGIKAVERTIKRKNLQIKVVTSFRKLLLLMNNFIFNYTNFLQIKGCAIGTKCAPTQGNIFVGIFEETKIHPLNKKCNYISDI